MYIDHIDGDGLNNQKSNLRVVTTRINLQNRHTHKTSKYPGVHWERESQKWKAQIRIGDKKKNLGRFDHEIDAAQAYVSACEKLVEPRRDHYQWIGK